MSSVTVVPNESNEEDTDLKGRVETRVHEVWEYIHNLSAMFSTETEEKSEDEEYHDFKKSGFGKWLIRYFTFVETYHLTLGHVDVFLYTIFLIIFTIGKLTCMSYPSTHYFMLFFSPQNAQNKQSSAQSAVAMNAQDATTPYVPGSRDSFPRTFQTIATVRAAWEAPALRISNAGDWFNYMQGDFIPRMFPQKWYSGEAVGSQGWPGVLEIRGLRTVGPITIRQVIAILPCLAACVQAISTWCTSMHTHMHACIHTYMNTNMPAYMQA
jgi:hypothetical protein